MPLTLTLAEGDDFYVGGDRWVVDQVHLTEGFVLVGPDGQVVEVDSSKAEVLAPSVKVSDGHRVLAGKARVVLNAPRSISILRGDLYREQGGS